MKRLTATVLSLLFLYASTFGSFAVVWSLPADCVPIAIEECDPEAIYDASAVPGYALVICCSAQKIIPVKKPKPRPDKTSVVWPIFLVLDPSLVPCCARVKTDSELSDFYHKEPAPPTPANVTGGVAPTESLPDSDVMRPLPFSRPPGVHPIIPSTVLLI